MPEWWIEVNEWVGPHDAVWVAFVALELAKTDGGVCVERGRCPRRPNPGDDSN